MQRLRWLAILMGITILGITGFQGYWLHDNYEREKQNLEIKTNVDFRQTIVQLQAAKLKLEKMSWQGDSLSGPSGKGNVVFRPRKRKPYLPDSSQRKLPPISIINLLQEKINQDAGDSGKARAYIISGKDGFIKKLSSDSPGATANKFNTKFERFDIKGNPVDLSFVTKDSNAFHKGGKVVTLTYDVNARHGNSDSGLPSEMFYERHEPRGMDEADVVTRGPGIELREKNVVFRLLSDIDSIALKDSVTVKEIVTRYGSRLKEDGIDGLDFAVTRLDSNHVNSNEPNEVTIGFAKPIAYRLTLENKTTYLLKKLMLPILFSLVLVGITIVSFVLLYRSVVRQRRLAELKNDFISNVTHELKTPIATVGVAIEALKNFNAIHDPQRTKEYLDISQNELQRLSLLVDKVLKLSMFEKKEMELKKEQFDCKQLAEEVMNSMRLQFEKYHAKVKLHTEGENFTVEADKLHITSVIYNLLDNALKYSSENPVIDVYLRSNPQYLEFSVRDNGIGIPPAYKEKVFDKFFRVPSGDKHNVKGYGLGLSYVSEVIRRHQGQVFVESELGKGSTFTAKFPYA
jgi:two-component system, OmpR family, phosphate regulon sensor histidine kinase PhoR